MRVLFATSEATPFIKSGGLADVLGSLPKEMVKKGVESIVVLPKYQDMKLADEIEFVTNFNILVDQDYMVMMMIMKDLHSLILRF